VCLWRRPHFLERTLRSVAAQSHAALELYIWNNNPAMRDHVDTVVAQFDGLGVEVEHSPRNVGGFGRFYVARRLAERHPYVVFLDDDQVPAPDCVARLLAETTEESARGMWAFNFRGRTHFGDRIDAEPGEQVKYAGTGGLICDTSIFREPGLFGCPRRFWFVEDLWLSYYADHVLGWRLYKSAAWVDGVADHLDQSRALGPTKDRLFRYLVRRRGWDPALVERAGANAQARTVV
jgi:GT2 family glycosyltransferase